MRARDMKKYIKLLVLTFALFYAAAPVLAQKEVVIYFKYIRKGAGDIEKRKHPMYGVVVFTKSDSGARKRQGASDKQGVFREKLADGTYHFLFDIMVDANMPPDAANPLHNIKGPFDRDGNYKNQYFNESSCPTHDTFVVKGGKVFYKGKQTDAIVLKGEIDGMMLHEAERKYEGKSALISEPSDRTPKAGYENFDIFLRIPKDSIGTDGPHKDYRIVAQPVWYDKVEQTTYYGEPLTYYFKEYELVNLRESYFDSKDDQRGVMFAVEDLKHYDSTRRPSDDMLFNYSVNTNDTTIHKSNNGKTYDDQFFFNIPMRIKVPVNERDHDCLTSVQWVVTDYDHIIGGIHTDTILDGRNDPLRLLDYSVGTLVSETDFGGTIFFPEEKTGEMKVKERLQLQFNVGSAELIEDLGHNREELTKIEHVIEVVRKKRFATTNELEVMGWASPDGNYDKNKALAEQRARALIPQIRRFSNKPISIKSAVASWQTVLDSLEDRKQMDLHRELSALLETNPNPPINSRVNSELYEKLSPVFDAMHVNEFMADYSIQDVLGGEALVDRYKEDKNSLRDREYINLYRYYSETLGDYSTAEQICQYAHDQRLRDLKSSGASRQEILRNMLVLRNDLTAYKLHRNVGDTLLLHDYFEKDSAGYINLRLRDEESRIAAYIPPHVAINMASAHLVNRNVKKAETAMNVFDYLKSMQHNYSGLDTEAALIHELVDINMDPETADPKLLIEHSKRNEILISLLKGPDEKRYEALFGLCTDSVGMVDTIAYNSLTAALCHGRHYVDEQGTYDVDYNNNDLQEAATFLGKALESDPEVRDLAFSQAYLKPAFKVMDRNAEDEKVLLGIVFTRYNNDLNKPREFRSPVKPKVATQEENKPEATEAPTEENAPAEETTPATEAGQTSENTAEEATEMTNTNTETNE